MGSLDTSDLSNVLKDVSNRIGMNAQAAAIAREKGWVAPQEYDYARYTNTEPHKKPAEGEENAQDLAWASSAAKYEWNEEYGDVGPRNPELEKMLFQSEFTSRVGIKFNT
jgi:ATP-dependent RNA helicase DDX3X